MSREMSYEDLEVGRKLGPKEFTTTEEDIKNYMALIQWSPDNVPQGELFVPPCYGVSGNVRTLNEALGGAGTGVWAKSEHKYFNTPVPGKKLIKTGRIADKFVKRGKKYIVWELDTVDEDGRLIYRSRETSVWSLEERTD